MLFYFHCVMHFSLVHEVEIQIYFSMKLPLWFPLLESLYVSWFGLLFCWDRWSVIHRVNLMSDCFLFYWDLVLALRSTAKAFWLVLGVRLPFVGVTPLWFLYWNRHHSCCWQVVQVFPSDFCWQLYGCWLFPQVLYFSACKNRVPNEPAVLQACSNFCSLARPPAAFDWSSFFIKKLKTLSLKALFSGNHFLIWAGRSQSSRILGLPFCLLTWSRNYSSVVRTYSHIRSVACWDFPFPCGWSIPSVQASAVCDPQTTSSMSLADFSEFLFAFMTHELAHLLIWVLPLTTWHDFLSSWTLTLH